MSIPARATHRLLFALLAVALLVVLALVRCAVREPDEPAAAPIRAVNEGESAPRHDEPRAVGGPARRLPATARTTPTLDGIDPCGPVGEPEIPETFETRNIANVTLAWRADPDVDAEPFSPNMVGRVAQGILEDAAAATGTPRRDHLVIIVHPSLEELRGATRAPAWAGGLYDGAVHVPRSQIDELGVSLRTLRHEIMHAQLHVAVGCMPAWFNEGIAMYFEGRADVRGLLSLLRDRDLVDVDAMDVGGIQRLNPRSPERLYAQSLVMVLYALDHGHGDLAGLVSRYRARRDDERAQVWQRWFPDARAPQLVEFLAHRVFGIGTGAALDVILAGVVCCSNERDVSKLACRAPGAPPPEPDRTSWMDRTRSPPAYCSKRR